MRQWKLKKNEKGGGRGKRRGNHGEHVLPGMLGSTGICSQAARLRNALDSFVYKVMSSLPSGVESG